MMLTLFISWLVMGLLVIWIVIWICDDIKVKHLLWLVFMGLVWPITLIAMVIIFVEQNGELVIFKKRKGE